MTDAPPFHYLDGLTGREAEVQLLQDAYERVLESPQSCEAILVHGESGAGKTALVQHGFQPQQNDGTMISGKFDVLHNPKPYSAFVDALTQLCLPATWKNISNMEEFREQATSRITSSDRKVLSKLVPAVETIWTSVLLGSDSHESEGGLAFGQSSNDNTFAFARFTEAVRSFLFVVARFLSTPLVLFLDDVQAADKESLSLISSLTALHSESCNILLILTFRDTLEKQHEVKQNNMVSPTTAFRITDIQVGNLDADNVNKMISKLLRMSESETFPLSRLVTQRTGGNIYFTMQFLEMFKSERLLKYSFAVCGWEWDLERIRAETSVTESVAFLLTSKIRQLSSAVQTVLQLASCLGFYFDVSILKRIVTIERVDIVNVCAEEDLSGEKPITTSTPVLLSADEFNRAIEVSLAEGLIDSAWGTKYKFTHDRVLQAAYEMIPAGKELETLHWRIGQVLWTELHVNRSLEHDQPLVSDDWLLFAAADQLNRGTDCHMRTGNVVGPLDLARLNLEAGKTALEKSAFNFAADFFNKGVESTKYMWHSEYALCLELRTLSAETEYAASNFVTCDQRVDEILEHGRCLEDKLRAYLVKVQAQGVRGNILEAMDESVAVLRVLGERISRRPGLLQVLLELAKTKHVLRKTKIADFVSLPDMTDPLKIWATKFLQNVTLYSWYAGQNELLVVSVCRMVRLTAKFGISSQGPYVLATYGVTLGFLGDLTTAYEVGRVTLELTKRPHTTNCYARTVATVFTCLNYLKEPVVRNLDHYMDGYNAGIKSGEIDGAAMCLSMYGLLGIYLGKNLNVVLAEMDGFRQAYRNDIGSNCSMICLLPWHQCVLNLVGRSDNPLKLTGEILSEESYLIEVRRTGNEIARATFTIARMILLYLLCEVEAASNEVPHLDMNIVAKGTHLSTPFLLTFAALAMLASARKTRKRKYSQRARVLAKIMMNFAKAGNLNMPPLLELLAAEQTSLRRQLFPEEVKKAYDTAVRMASQSGFSVFEAIGNERAGEYMQSVGDTFWAETYLARAFLLYDEWGATTKTKQMAEKYSFLAEPINPPSGCRRSVGVSMRQKFNFKASNERRRLSAEC